MQDGGADLARSTAGGIGRLIVTPAGPNVTTKNNSPIVTFMQYARSGSTSYYLFQTLL